MASQKLSLSTKAKEQNGTERRTEEAQIRDFAQGDYRSPASLAYPEKSEPIVVGTKL